MNVYQDIAVTTRKNESLINITDEIKRIIKESKVKEGICVVYVPHTTAGITINSGLDEMTFEDIIFEIHRLIPTRTDFKHVFDTPSDASGHIKSVLVGNSISLIVHDGNPVLGHSQSILFFEFDGPRKRRVMVRIMGEEM